MANDAVAAEMLLESAITRMIIRHHMRIWRDVLFDNLLESFASHGFRVERTDITAAFHKGNNRSLVALVLAESMRPIFLLAADIRFVYFDSAAEFGQIHVSHCITDS